MSGFTYGGQESEGQGKYLNSLVYELWKIGPFKTDDLKSNKMYGNLCL